jgi:hypothetical protein
MDKWKYVVVDLPMEGETPFLFPPTVTHADVVRLYPGAKIIAAGFVAFRKIRGRLACFGDSASLNIKSRGEADEYLINRLLGEEL